MRFGFRELIFIVLLLTVPGGAYFFVFEPRTTQISELHAQIKDKQVKLMELESVTKRIPDLGKEIDRLSEAIELIEQKLPEERNVDEVLRQVWELAAKQNLIPKSIRTDKPLRNLSYSELPIQMEIVGNFDGFYSFLIELEKLPRIMQLPQMKLEKLKGKDSEEGQMKAKLILSVYFEADDTQHFGTNTGRRRRL